MQAVLASNGIAWPTTPAEEQAALRILFASQGIEYPPAEAEVQDTTIF